MIKLTHTNSDWAVWVNPALIKFFSVYKGNGYDQTVIEFGGDDQPSSLSVSETPEEILKLMEAV